MSLRFFVNDMTVVILITSTIVHSCATKEADSRIPPKNITGTTCDDSNIKGIELPLTDEFDKIVPEDYKIRATNTREYYKNPLHEYDQRDEKSYLEWRWLCSGMEMKQRNASGNSTTGNDRFETRPPMLKLIEADTTHLYNLMVKNSPALEAREQIKNISRLCSRPPTVFHDNDLRCRYNFQNDPFLLIAPLKEEVISSDPEITIFREVLYESEIKKLIEEGKNRMFGEKKKNTTSQNNIANCPRELAFFRDDDDLAEINTITRRTRDITGRQKHYLQPWQITFYETGGYFPMHSDLDHVDEEEVENQGLRMATVSFILNNADAGGTTIFPLINIRPDPNRGDAILWYNVRLDGSEDIRMRHAMCPVLMGCRWEFVKRINQKMMLTE